MMDSQQQVSSILKDRLSLLQDKEKFYELMHEQVNVSITINGFTYILSDKEHDLLIEIMKDSIKQFKKDFKEHVNINY